MLAATQCKRSRRLRSCPSFQHDYNILEQLYTPRPFAPGCGLGFRRNRKQPIESIDDETLSILKQCPKLCGELTPCYVQKHLSLPQDFPLHWEILCMFFMEPWSVDACVKAILPEPILPERAAHRCPHGRKKFTIQEMTRGMADFVDVLREVMPR